MGNPNGASIRGWYELMIAENYGFNPDDLDHSGFCSGGGRSAN